MRKRRKLTSDDDEVRSQKSHYTNVNKISSRHVELSLEVEMDDEVREIIKSPEKCTSALLDVTVIKPKGLDKYTTEKQTLKTDQVKKMIASMNLDNDEKKVLMEKIFGENANVKYGKEWKKTKEKGVLAVADTEEVKRKSCLSSKNKHHLGQSMVELDQGDVQSVTDGIQSALYSVYNQLPHPKSSIMTQQQQIYTTPRTFDNITTMFQCKNKDKKNGKNEKMEPCLCQNCAIVGILTDSQKKPFSTEPIPHSTATNKESNYRRPLRRKSVSFKHLEDLPSTSKDHERCEAVFKLLNSRINELEKRVAKQEERAVPKDYFKKIITKLVNHLTKLTNYTTANDEKTTALSQKYQSTHPFSSKYRPSTSDRHTRYCVNQAFMENTYKVPAEKEYEPKPCSSEEPPKSPTESIWKWGEEFLSTGKDLKNKVVMLLEETLHNLKKSWEKPENQEKFEEDMQSIVKELSKNLAQTVGPKASKSRLPEVAGQPLRKKIISDLSETKRSGKPLTYLDKRTAKPSLIPRIMRQKGPTLKVAYVNPQLKKWPEESSVSFKVDSSDDYELQKQTMSEPKKKQYKKEFLKVLEHTKTADKFKLWQNIWNQALENRQTKNDIVTIQIPDPNDLIRHKMVHLEFTIGQLEKLLTSVRNSENNSKK